MPYFDYPDNVYINPYYLDVTPDIRREMKFRAALYGTKTRSVGVTYGNMYDSIVSTKNIEWPYQKVPWAVITSLFDKNLQLGLSYDKEMSDNQGNLTLYSTTRNAPAKPLLTSVEISNEGQRGSLLKGKFAFTYFPELTPTGLDLEQLQQAFFTPGRRVHIAFGWSTYAQVPRVNKLEFAGVIFGFNWTFNPNMSISAEVQIVSPSSLAIGFSGDQTYDDDGDAATSATGDELPKATNLLTVIEKDLRGQKGDVELDSGTLVSWLPKNDTVTKTFDYVLVKLPITGFSSYLESSAANLQDVEWTGREPDTIIVTPGTPDGSTGQGTPDGGTVPKPDTWEDDSGQLTFVSAWMKTVKQWVTTELVQQNYSDYKKPSGNGVDESDWVLADPNRARESGKQYNPSHSTVLMQFKKDIEKILSKSQNKEWMTDDDGLTKKFQEHVKLAKELNDRSILLSKNWGRWVGKGKTGEFNNPNYVGGIRLTRIMSLLKEYDDNNTQMINVLNDLINIKRLEELHDFKMYRVESKPHMLGPDGLFIKNNNGDSERNKKIYPDGWQGAGFDDEKIFDQYMSIGELNFKSHDIIEPLKALYRIPKTKTAANQPREDKKAVEQKINSWMKILQHKISPENPNFGSPERLSDDRVEAAKKEGVGGGEAKDVKTVLIQFASEWRAYRKWLIDRNSRQLDDKNKPDPDYDKYKTNKETTVGDVDMETIEQNIPKAVIKTTGVGAGIETVKDRTNQAKWIDEILNKIQLIQDRFLPNGESNPDYGVSYEQGVIYGKDSNGNEFFPKKSSRFQQKKNQSPSSSPGAGGTGPTTEVIQGQKIKEDRTYWYITLGDLVNFTNNLIDKYTINADEKRKYTFPYFNMVAFGNETDYNKNLKSAYPVDVYFPDKIMGNYGTFQPFSVAPFDDLQRTFFISEKKGETPTQEKKARVAADVINIGQILIGIDYIRKTYRNFLHDNSTNIAYKNITSFFEDIIKRINLASGDIYQLTVMLFEEPEKLTNKETSPKDPLSTGDDGTKRRALLSIEDSNLARKHTQMMDEDDDDLLSNDPRDYYVVTPYRFDANIMKPLIRNVSLTSRPSKEATFAAYIAARGEEGFDDKNKSKAPPMSVDVDLTKPEYKDTKEYEKQYATNYKEKIKLENMAQSDGFNERWSDTYRGVLTKMKRLTYKPNMPTEENSATQTDPKAGSTDQTGAHWLNMAIYPIELTLTIDGINGFKFGDVIRTTMIPSHYNTRWKVVFTITKIIHKVTPSGWETTLHTAARLPLDDPNTGIAEVGKVQPATAFNSYGPSQDQLQNKR